MFTQMRNLNLKFVFFVVIFAITFLVGGFFIFNINTTAFAENEITLVVAGWSFNTSSAIADSGSVNNLVKTVSLINIMADGNGYVTGYSGKAITAKNWNGMANEKYWQAEINTIGYENLQLSSKQRSSSTGPKDFKVQYRVGTGAWTDFGSTVVLGDNFTSGIISNYSLPSTCNNQSLVYIRWLKNSDTAVNNSLVGSTGTSAIDDIIISGTNITSETTLPTVTSVSSIANISVANGTALTAAGLPNNATVTLSDSTTPSYEVTWNGNSPTYNSTTAGTYVFTGTLTMPGGVTNPANRTASVNVIVAEAPAPDQYTLTTSAETGGTISPITGPYNGNSTVTITATAGEGYHFNSWSGDLSDSDNPATITMTGDKSVTANFEADAPVTHTLTYSSGANGHIDGDTPQTVNNGDSGLAVTAVANSGYNFVDWSDGGLTAERIDTNIQANKSFTANFAVTPSSTKEITVFSFATPEATGVITETNIAINVPHGTDVTTLVPTITFSGTSVSPNTGVSQNFSSPVTYTVTAANSSTEAYIVTVTILEKTQTTSRGSSGSYARPIVKAPVVNTAPVVGKVLGTENFNFTRFIKFKMGSYRVKLQGNEVTELQKFLNTLGYTTLIVDGKFGPKTKTAVIKFQIANGLKGDGVVGPLTRSILNK